MGGDGKHVRPFPAKISRRISGDRFKRSGKMSITGKTEGTGNGGDGFIRVEKEHLCLVDFPVSYILIEGHTCFFAKDGGQVLRRYRYGGGHFIQCNWGIKLLVDILKTAFNTV